MTQFHDKSLADLKLLKITQVQWNWKGSIEDTSLKRGSIYFHLSDGNYCKSGKEDFDESYVFDDQKKITKVVCYIDKDEHFIGQINFFSDKERIIYIGKCDDEVKEFCRRKEEIDIADDEQLIGCELFHENAYFIGV